MLFVLLLVRAPNIEQRRLASLFLKINDLWMIDDDN